MEVIKVEKHEIIEMLKSFSSHDSRSRTPRTINGLEKTTIEAHLPFSG